MSAHLQPKYQLIFALCLALGISLLCAEVDARKRDASDETSLNEIGRRPDWNKKDKEKKFNCPSLFGAFPDPTDCESFYVCVGGIPKHRKCPAWRKFDKYRKSCLSIFIAVCEDGNEEKTTKTTKTTTPKEDRTTTVKDGKFTCPGIGGSYPHPEDCSKYYKCTFFISSLKTCPEDQLFDGVKKECKPASEVHCGSRRRPSTIAPSTTPEPTTTTELTTPEPTTTELTTPEPTTTTELTTPEPTTTTELTTPEPTTTTELTTPEPTTTELTTPEQTTTTELTTVELTTTSEPTTTTVATSPKPTGPPETDCEEDDLDCIIKETGEIPDWFECPDDIGSYRHPSSKKLFIFCINKKPFVKRCGQDLVFSDELGTCVNA